MHRHIQIPIDMLNNLISWRTNALVLYQRIQNYNVSHTWMCYIQGPEVWKYSAVHWLFISHMQYVYTVQIVISTYNYISKYICEPVRHVLQYVVYIFKVDCVYCLFAAHRFYSDSNRPEFGAVSSRVGQKLQPWRTNRSFCELMWPPKTSMMFYVQYMGFIYHGDWWGLNHGLKNELMVPRCVSIHPQSS